MSLESPNFLPPEEYTFNSNEFTETGDEEDIESLLRDYWNSQFIEAGEEVQKEDPIAQECRHVKFKSLSQGRGRPPRKYARDVEMVGYNGRYIQIKEGTIQGEIDELARWLMPDTEDRDEYDQFLQRLRNQSKK